MAGEASSLLNGCNPILAMASVQLMFAVMALSAKQAFSEGFHPMILVVYRQAIAAMLLVPVSIFARGRRISQLGLTKEGFLLVFLTSLIGITLSQFFYYEGLALSSPALATAMTNLVPAITFLLAVLFRLEKVDIWSLRGLAKIIGTVVSVGGAMCLAFFKGPALLNSQPQVPLTSSLMAQLLPMENKWLMGWIFLMACACCWSLWLILQVPLCKKYSDPLSLSTWMCFLSIFQTAALAILFVPNLEMWKITSFVQLFACMFVGIFGSGVSSYLLSCSVQVRGPHFSAMFNPLNSVLATFFSVVLLHEKLHVGSLVGAAAVVVGLYVVLWGKAKDHDTRSKLQEQKEEDDLSGRRNSIDEEAFGINEPLLAERERESSHDVESTTQN